jgi:hypothetical protein
MYLGFLSGVPTGRVIFEIGGVCCFLVEFLLIVHAALRQPGDKLPTTLEFVDLSLVIIAYNGCVVVDLTTQRSQPWGVSKTKNSSEIILAMFKPRIPANNDRIALWRVQGLTTPTVCDQYIYTSFQF